MLDNGGDPLDAGPREDAGQSRLAAEARAAAVEDRGLGDRLLVAVNRDASVRRIKGPSRPAVPERQRAELVAALMQGLYQARVGDLG